MGLLIDFINSKEVSKSKLYLDLGICKDEALILQYICKRFIVGEIEINVCNMLLDIFGKENYLYLEKISHVKNLLKNSHLIHTQINITQDTPLLELEILNVNVGLSPSFIKYLELGFVEQSNDEEILPYTEHLDYLQDQFLHIEYYQKLVQNRGDFNPQKLKEKIKSLEEKISKRLAKSSVKLRVEELFKEHNLNEKEQIIFLTLLREEYVGDLDAFRELNSLILLISNDNYEKIKNRILLEEDSKLIDAGLIDYEEMITAFGGVSRSFFINEEILQNIMHPNKKAKKLKLDILVKEQEIFELISPTTSLDDVVMHPKTRELMDDLLKQVDKNVIARLKKWGIRKKSKGIDAKILLYGPPGTGKTMTANSLAKSLKKSVLSFDCSKILSKYVGESEQNVRRIFDSYREICRQSKSEPILLLNEADQFLSSRTEVANSGADKMHNQMQNIFLEQIEKFEGILVATTNFLESLDKAFSRRFDYKIAFEKPDFSQRLDLWRKVLPQEAIYEEDFDIKKLAKYPLSGGQIVVILKNTALRVAVKEEPIFTMEDFEISIQRELSGAFGEKKNLGFVN
ncbi:MAG: AAA family ATPase [Proteobacteria bacterium]|nr:MAG: AAA family ATPase [Pseudomonadota bacterium]